MRRGVWAASSALVLAFSAALSGCTAAPTGASAASACWPGPLTISPASAQPGDSIAVSAKPARCSIDFTDDRWYRVELQYQRWNVDTVVRVRVAQNGAFRSTIRIPDGAPPGRPIVAVTAGYQAACADGGACAGVMGEVQVMRSDFEAPNIRALQARLNAEPMQEGELTDLGSGRVCLNLDRPWTSGFDIALPSGWRSSGQDVIDAKGTVVARVGDWVRLRVGATRTHAQLPGCKQDRTVVTAETLQRVTKPPATPPGGRLIVATSTRVIGVTPGAARRTGTLLAERQGDYLCLSLRSGDGTVRPLRLPPGTTARPDGTLLDRSDTPFARPGDRITALIGGAPVPRPVGCDGRGTGLDAYRITGAA